MAFKRLTQISDSEGIPHGVLEAPHYRAIRDNPAYRVAWQMLELEAQMQPSIAQNIEPLKEEPVTHLHIGRTQEIITRIRVLESNQQEHFKSHGEGRQRKPFRKYKSYI